MSKSKNELPFGAQVKLATREEWVTRAEMLAEIEKWRKELHERSGLYEHWYDEDVSGGFKTFEELNARLKPYGLYAAQGIENNLSVAYLIEDHTVVATVRSWTDVKDYLDHLDRLEDQRKRELYEETTSEIRRLLSEIPPEEHDAEFDDDVGIRVMHFKFKK